MELIDRDSFFSITKKFNIIPYNQFVGMYYFLALSGEQRIKFFIDNSIQPTIACFGHEKKFLTKRLLQIEGECYAQAKNVNTENIKSFYSDICKLGYDFIEVCSNVEYNFTYETALRQAGFLRPVGQFSMPITKIIDLTSEIIYNTNWKRNIRKAGKYPLEFEPINNLQIKDCDEFVNINNQMLKRKAIKCPLSAHQVYTLCNKGDYCLYFVSIQGTRIATLITHQKNTHAGSIFSASNEEALRTSASYFMYKELFIHLNKNGYQTFDVEKLVPSTKAVNNVFLFKDGVEGTHIQLNGEWSWYKKSYYRPLMYFIKKYLMKKREY